MTTPGGQFPDGFGTGPAEGDTPLASGSASPPYTPPGFGPPGQTPTLHGQPLAAPAVPGQRVFFVLMAVFAVLAAAGGVGFFLTQRVEHGAIPVTPDGVRTLFPERPDRPFPSAIASPAPALGPVPKALRYTGSGRKTITVRRPEPGIALLYVKANPGGDRLLVRRIDESGHDGATLLVTFDPYEGVQVLDVPVRPGAERLEVEASGAWTIEVRSARAAPSVTRTARGSGDSVFWYTGGATVATLSRSGGFGATPVLTYESGHPRLLTILTGNERTRRPFPAGPVLVAVDSDTPWTIAFAAS